MDRRALIWISFLTIAITGTLFYKQQNSPQPYVRPDDNYQSSPIEEDLKQEITIGDIASPIPGYLSYNDLIEQLKDWHKQAPALTEYGTYGKSSEGKDLYCFKLSNRYSNFKKKKVLITACIHGNEPLSTAVVVGYIGTILDTYNESDEIKKLLDEREIYFIPVVSPDSYPNSRAVDGVDPNRNFPTKNEPDKRAVPPVECLKKFVKSQNFDAIISGHTFGRVFGVPWGDSRSNTDSEEDYKRIVGEMSRLSKYKIIHLHEMYGQPIYGTECDWYYRNGAFSLVIEYGTHQRKPTKQETDDEFNRTYKAVLFFLKEAPEVRSKSVQYIQFVNNHSNFIIKPRNRQLLPTRS